MNDANLGVIGMILAGGQARRMGGVEKALLRLGGLTLLERAVARAAPQVDALLLNANGDPARFALFGIPVVADRIGGFLGPLAGILSGLEWLRENRPDAAWLATFSCDAPFFPGDLVSSLLDAARASGAMAAFATSGGQRHPVFAVWSTAITDTSETVLTDLGLRAVDAWLARLTHVAVDFPTGPCDPFLNINTPADLAQAEALLANEPSLL